MRRLSSNNSIQFLSRSIISTTRLENVHSPIDLALYVYYNVDLGKGKFSYLDGRDNMCLTHVLNISQLDLEMDNK